MENIVIVGAISTGFNLVEDVIKRGYHPVVLNINSLGHYFLDKAKTAQIKLKDKCDFIEEQPDYQDTLAMVKKLHPKIVLAGTEVGVETATRLAEDLGLPGNPTSILPQMKEKSAMHEALRKHGLRYIRGKVIHSPEEAADFYDELHVKRVVVKENGGAGSVGLHICNSKEELYNTVRKAFTGKDMYDRELKSLLVQEMIEGLEYIVNTVSCKGKVRLTSLFRYRKTETPDGNKIYRYTESVNTIGIEQVQLIQYAYQVARAIGVQYGAIHGEYMMDDRGPVLIEVNCRPMGGGMPGDFVDLLNGQHESDSHLDSYLDPVKFEEEAKKPYRTHCKLILKHMVSPGEIDLFASPILSIAPHLKSYHSAVLSKVVADHLEKTVDLHTSSGTIFLAHPDSRVVMDETNLLCDIEDFYPEMLYQAKPIEYLAIGGKTDQGYIDNIVRVLGFGTNYTLFGDGIGCQIDDIVRKENHYSNVIIDLTVSINNLTLEDILSAYFDLVASMKRGSKLVLTKKIHNMDRLGIAYTVAAMRLSGLLIEAPLSEYPDLLVGTVP